MEKINKDLVLAAIVRTFFQYFVVGIVESQSDCTEEERFEPKNIKSVMIDNFESISEVFNREAFYSIARMNYSQEEMERFLKDFVTGTTTYMDLVRFACRTDDFYSAMVTEYKRNFEQLLCGRILSQDELAQSYARCPEIGEMEYALAENIINNMAATAYQQGKQLTARKH
ncbi:MAG: hypothetical protein Q4D41_03595 [Prevotellaceae bacterium]|nr:hypothetical protein [Prevotellaceae bacterium]